QRERETNRQQGLFTSPGRLDTEDYLWSPLCLHHPFLWSIDQATEGSVILASLAGLAFYFSFIFFTLSPDTMAPCSSQSESLCRAWRCLWQS
ncbi:hypothetical protein DPEC_G00034810, partial [Dallia pectoralis]